MSESARISTERRGHVFLIGLDRAAKRNAFDIGMYEELGAAYAELDADADLRCGVLFAHGEHFTAGLDLAQFAAAFASGSMPIRAGAIDPLGLTGPVLSKPIVCAVQGICFTIGIELLLATDIRLATPDARFGQIEIRRGIYPVGGATIRLPREVGWGNAMRYLLTADEFSGTEAHRMGMVQEVVEASGLLARALEIAGTIAAQAPLGVRATLASSRLALSASEAAAARRLLPDLQPILASDDVQEGMQSFLQRRKAEFKGR